MVGARIRQARAGVGVSLRDWARQLKNDVIALYFAARDPRTPWIAKFIAGAVVAYALSPIDLIPDFIPVLGLLDDLILVPLGIWIALKLIPAPVMADARRKAALQGLKPRSYMAAVVVVLVWLVLAAGAIEWTRRAGWWI